MSQEVNGSPVVNQHMTEIDKKMEEARIAQQEEILHEQVRMERLHVSAMVLSGILSGTVGLGCTPVDAAKLSLEYADELLKAIIK
tara:strand:+ start:5685 stop:5939 length:255 start_codon:yes stop_codon:yes gene_type:complete